MGVDDREMFVPPKIGQVMPWLQHGAKVRASDVERAIAEAEARGFRRAAEALRDREGYALWSIGTTHVDAHQPTRVSFVDLECAANYLESLTAGQTDG